MFPVGYTWALVTPAISLSLNGRMVVNSQGNLQQSNQMYILAAVRSH
jgi:hypothetical protein